MIPAVMNNFNNHEFEKYNSCIEDFNYGAIRNGEYYNCKRCGVIFLNVSGTRHFSSINNRYNNITDVWNLSCNEIIIKNIIE